MATGWMPAISATILFSFMQVFTPGTGWAYEGEPKPFFVEEHESTCTHYENRARFKPRGETVEFVVYIADSCSLALKQVRTDSSANADVRRTSIAYLERITELRRTIIEMNVDRTYGDAPMPGAQPPRHDGSRAGISFSQVTPTGEYLIAGRLGLRSALRDWLDSGVSFDLALR